MDSSAPSVTGVTRSSAPWINRSFALLWSGQAVSFLGDFVFNTTVILWIATDIAAGQSWAPLAVSGVLICVFLPDFVGAPLAGVFVDRWDKRRTMLTMDALQAVLVASLLLASGPVALSVAGRLVLIYAVVFLTTMCQQFFSPARMALIGDVVHPDDVSRASGLGQISMNLAVIAGPPIAAPLFFAFGVKWALIIDSLSFLGSLLAVWLVHAPPAARSVAPGQGGDVLRELTDGIRFSLGNRVLRTLLIAVTVVMLGAGAINALDIFFVTQNLHASARLYGLITASLGLGAVIGAVLASIFAERIGPARLFWLSLIAAAAGMAIYARMTTFWPACVVIGLLGIPVGTLNVCLMPLVLRVTPRDMIGRVMAVLGPPIALASVGSVVISGLLVSTVLHGFHAAVLGMQLGPIDTIFSAAAVLALSAGLYSMRNLRGVELTPRADPAPEDVPLPMASSS